MNNPDTPYKSFLDSCYLDPLGHWNSCIAVYTTTIQGDLFPRPGSPSPAINQHNDGGESGPSTTTVPVTVETTSVVRNPGTTNNPTQSISPLQVRDPTSSSGTNAPWPGDKRLR